MVSVRSKLFLGTPFPMFLQSICVADGQTSFDLNILHFHVVHLLKIQCVKALNQLEMFFIQHLVLQVALATTSILV